MLPVILPILYGVLSVGQSSPPAATPMRTAGAAETDRPDGQTSPPAEPSPGKAGDMFFGRDQSGRLGGMSVDEALQSGAEFLRKLQADRPAPTAPVYISRLFLDGEVTGEYVEFRVSITVEVTRPEGWYDVPLALHEAHVHESTYEGPGAQAPRTGGPADEGLHWIFRGQGAHRLELKLDVPLKQSPAGQQLQLRLPQLPDLFRPRCVLHIPGGPVAVTARSGTPVPVRTLETGGQEIDLNVSGQRLDLSWRRHADETPTLSAVVTSFDLHRNGERLELTAVQQCDVEQGTVTRVEVHVPSDAQFRLDTVGRIIGSSQPVVPLRRSEIEGQPGWVQVDLDEPMSSRFVLEWKFTRAFSQSGDLIRVDGLDVAAARSQQGRVEVQPIDGYDVHCLPQEGTGLQETNPVSPTALKAFEFRRQPFQLMFDLARIQPKLIAAPRYFLQLDTDQADLYMELQVTVLAGVVDELLIGWPAGAADGWNCNSQGIEVQSESGLERTSLKIPAAVVAGGTGQPPGTFGLQLSQPVFGRPTDAARLRLVVPFSRTIPPDKTGFELTLPRLGGATTTSGGLFIAGDLKLEPSLFTAPKPLEKLTPPDTAPAGVPSEFVGPGVLGYSLAGSPGVLQISWVEHTRMISAETSLSVVELRRGAVNVVQRMSYAVSYGEVSSLLLELPPAFDQLFPPGIRQLSRDGENIGVLFQLADGTLLDAEPVGANLRVPLPAPRHGQFDLLIDYVLPVPEANAGQAASFELPVVRALDADFGRTVVSMKDSERIRLADSEQGWTLRPPRSGGVAWQTSGPRSVVRLAIDESLLNVPQQYTIESAFLLTRFGEQGDAITLGEYEIHEAPQRLLIMLPRAEGPAEFHWNGATLELHREVLPIDGALDQYTLDLPTAEGEPASGRLSVKYRSPSHGVLGPVARCSVDFPRFPGKVWVSETWFEVVLPPGSQLFEPPPDMTPQYGWQRQVAVWVRQPTPEYRQRRADLIPALADPQFRSPRGNSYAYYAVGTVTRTRFGAMSQSLIVLIGAGLTLFLGFIFGRVPATRNMFSLLVLGFVFALASVWHLELMQLLLQPALLGLLLAAVATTFDVATRRRLALTRAESTFDRVSPDEHESRPSGLSSNPPLPARTAVYRAAGTSDSGGSP